MENAEIDVLLVGVAEYPDGTGWTLTFQAGLSDREDRKQLTEAYSLVTEDALTVDSGVENLRLEPDKLVLKLSAASAAQLALSDTTIEVRLAFDARRVLELRERLARVFEHVSKELLPTEFYLFDTSECVSRLRRRAPKRPARKVVEFRVLRALGPLAVYEMVGQEDQKPIRYPAADLAAMLGVSPANLVGRRFTCDVEKDRAGTTYTNYQLIEER